MPLDVDLRIVARSIDDAKNMFNSGKIEKAQAKFREFALGAEKQVNELNAKMTMLVTEADKLRKNGQKAVEELNQAQATIQYQETQIANAQIENKILAETNKKLERKKSKKEIFTRLLDNGNTETTKQKGRVTVIEEKAPNGNMVSREINLIDKSNRKTLYNPVNGKRTETTTNINGSVRMVYDLDGKNTAITKDSKPEITVLKKYKKNENTVVQELSDGTIITIAKDSDGKIFTTKQDANEIVTELLIEGPRGGKVHNKYLPNMTVSQVVNGGKTITKTISQNDFGERIVSEYTVETPQYTAVYKPTSTDSFGTINKGEWTIKYNVSPKGYNVPEEGYVQLGMNPNTGKFEILEAILKTNNGCCEITTNKSDKFRESFSRKYIDADGKPSYNNMIARIPSANPDEIEANERFSRINVEPYNQGHIY